MHEHHWWLIYKDGEKSCCCSICGHVEIAGDHQCSITIVEDDPAYEDRIND